MNLLYITNARIPTEKAHGYQIMKMCEAFSGQGLSIKLLVPKRRNLIKDDAFKYFDVRKLFFIKKIFCIDFLGKLPGNKFWFLVQDLSFALVAGMHLLFKPRDLNIYTRDAAVAFILLFLGFNPVFELHVWSLKNKMQFFIVKRCRKIAVISRGLKSELLKIGIPEDKILVAPDGVDIEQFDINITKEDCRSELDLPQDKKIILYTGHLYEWKGVNTLVESTSNLKDDFLILIVGGTKDGLEKLSNFIKERDLSKVKIVGHQPHDMIPKYLKSADCLVLPNSAKKLISSKYTSPLKLFEYMASKRSIIASDLPSLKEILNEKNCIFFEPDNSKDLADKIKLVFLDPQNAQRLSDIAFSDVQKYSWTDRAKNIFDFIAD